MFTVSIIDYGSGNLRSVYNAIKKIQINSKKKIQILVTNKSSDVEKSSHIILPGVGSFKGCLNGFYAKPGLFDVLSENVLVKEKFFLGICVGMQMLADKGFEDGENKGFGWINGEVLPIKPLNKKFKVPHIGWNNLQIKNDHSFLKFLNSRVEISNNKTNAYFVHSYYFKAKNESMNLINTNYSRDLTAMIGYKNILGTQFHPEKSQKFGLDFLETFLYWKG